MQFARHLLPLQKPETQAVLFVNLPNLVYNWKHYTKSSSAKPAAVVKVSSNLDIQGNGYGVGLVEASQALADAGCDTFFVATLGEALQLRASLANSTIYCLGGFAPGSYDAVAGAKVRPVLGSLEEAVEWCRGPAPAPYALHVDSGMNRLGLQPGALPEFAAALADGTLRKPALVMSHLAEADEPASDYNPTQLANFAAAREQLRLGDVPASLANSGGCLLGPQYHFDLLRPGYGLYGGHLHRAKANPGRPVVELYARIIEAKQVPAGAPVSYR